jgi:hypothetical protein
MKNAMLRWYNWSLQLWFELTLDGPMVAKTQDPPPATFRAGLSEFERKEYDQWAKDRGLPPPRRPVRSGGT